MAALWPELDVSLFMVKRPAIYLPSLRLVALAGPAVFVAAGLLFVLVAFGAALLMERVSESAVKSKLLTEGITWADAESDGLQVHLVGTAPNEAARYRVVNLVGSIVDAARIRDDLEVPAVKAIEAPRFSLEILRNDDGIQLIGLLPAGEAEAAVVTTATALAKSTSLSEMIETAAYPATAKWEAALAFGVRAFEMLPRSKISISADKVSVTAIATSEAEKRNFEAELKRAAPSAVPVAIDISAPRPVLTPFTLRFVKDAGGARFDACSADTAKARDEILAAASAAGATEQGECTIGLGVPSPRWGQATRAGIAALGAMASGTITFKDADVTLQAGSDVSQADFDRISGDLEAALPDVFSLTATLDPRPEGRSEGPAEFTAILDVKTGKVELRGRLTDAAQRDVAENFAKAAFGADRVYQAAVIDAELPDGWPLRVLAGLEALGKLDGGTLVVRADTVDVAGVSGNQQSRAEIAQILSGKLGQGKTFKVDVRYDEALDPIASIPTPEECSANVQNVLAAQKITFPPGSTEVDSAAGKVMAALATALTDCKALRMEIAGHTDAQGSEEGNLATSQARAEAVLVALQGRGVDVSGFTAKGYGEAVPIADNETEAGREANRRIEFTLAGAAPAAATATAATDTAPDAASPTPQVSPAGAAPNSSTPDFSADDSPSVAPTEKTIQPKSRPARNG